MKKSNFVKKGVFFLGEQLFDLAFVQKQFRLEGAFQSSKSLNDGHINTTYQLCFQDNQGQKKDYVVQKINTYVFKDPDALMENIVGVTSFLRREIEKNGGILVCSF